MHHKHYLSQYGQRDFGEFATFATCSMISNVEKTKSNEDAILFCTLEMYVVRLSSKVLWRSGIIL